MGKQSTVDKLLDRLKQQGRFNFTYELTTNDLSIEQTTSTRQALIAIWPKKLIYDPAVLHSCWQELFTANTSVDSENVQLVTPQWEVWPQSCVSMSMMKTPTRARLSGIYLGAISFEKEVGTLTYTKRNVEVTRVARLALNGSTFFDDCNIYDQIQRRKRNSQTNSRTVPLTERILLIQYINRAQAKAAFGEEKKLFLASEPPPSLACREHSLTSRLFGLDEVLSVLPKNKKKVFKNICRNYAREQHVSYVCWGNNKDVVEW